MCNSFIYGNRIFYEIMWKKFCRVEEATADIYNTVHAFACWVIKTTDTHSEYVTLIAVPHKKILSEHAST